MSMITAVSRSMTARFLRISWENSQRCVKVKNRACLTSVSLRKHVSALKIRYIYSISVIFHQVWRAIGKFKCMCQ